MVAIALHDPLEPVSKPGCECEFSMTTMTANAEERLVLPYPVALQHMMNEAGELRKQERSPGAGGSLTQLARQVDGLTQVQNEFQDEWAKKIKGWETKLDELGAGIRTRPL